MIPLFEKKVIHLEVTNACNMKCANCTRFIGHYKKTFFITLDEVRQAIVSLKGFKGNIGLMGGEPTIHPQFAEICKIYQEMIPDIRRRQLWTNGCNWKKYEAVIYETFDPDLIIYNDHKNPDEGIHQPLLIAADDIIDDKELMWKLIDECWIQKRWAASMTPKGGFFCEVAAAQDNLFNGPGGYSLEKGWWNKTPEQFKDQIRRYCLNCSAAIPMHRPSAHDVNDTISKSVEKKLKCVMSPKYLQGGVTIYNKKLSKDDINSYKNNWTPWNHRSFKQCTPELFAP